MARLTDNLLLQYVDDTGVVLVDESAGTEIVIPFGDPLIAAQATIDYFVEQSRAAGAIR